MEEMEESRNNWSVGSTIKQDTKKEEHHRLLETATSFFVSSEHLFTFRC